MGMANEVGDLASRLERLEGMDEVFEVRQRVRVLEAALIDVVSYLAWREAMPPGVPGWCELSHVLQLLGAGDRCEELQAGIRRFREELGRRAAGERGPGPNGDAKNS